MKHIIFKKLEDGTYGEKLGTYEGPKDDTSANRSYLMAEPMASHFELPEEIDEDCAILVLVSESEVEGVIIPAHYEVQEDATLVSAKAAKVMDDYISNKLNDAVNFGADIIREFTKENIVMGITTDNMTGVVRKAMSEVIIALQTGSLYDAIIEAKAIPADKKDAKYITNARLLSFINKIETKLNITLSTSI
jgi:hypothetical protein